LGETSGVQAQIRTKLHRVPLRKAKAFTQKSAMRNSRNTFFRADLLRYASVMGARGLLFLAVICTELLFSSNADGRILIGNIETFESSMVQSDFVVCGKIEREAAFDSLAISPRPFWLRADEVLKGKSFQRTRLFGPTEQIRGLIGHKMLFCVKTLLAGNPPDLMPVAIFPLEENVPTNLWSFETPSQDWAALHQPAIVLQIAREVLADPRAASGHARDINVGSMILPRIARTERLLIAETNSEFPQVRFQTARALAEFNSPQSIAALKRLLDDPACVHKGGPDRIFYFVREAASESLFTLGVPVARRTVEDTTFSCLQISGPLLRTILGIGVTLLGGCWAVLYVVLRRKRLMWFGIVLRVVLCVTLLAFAFEPDTRQALVLGGGFRQEFEISQGKLQYSLLRESSSARGLMLVTPNPEWDVLSAVSSMDEWSTDSTYDFSLVERKADLRRDWRDFQFESGSTHDSMGVPSAYFTTEVPIFWIVGALLLVPILQLLVAAPRKYRQYKRHRSGLCERCGYDLRASNGLCPECGERNVLKAV